MGTSKLAFCCVALGIAGALSALGGQPAVAGSRLPAAPAAAGNVCLIARDYAADKNPAAAAELRRALGCEATASIR